MGDNFDKLISLAVDYFVYFEQNRYLNCINEYLLRFLLNNLIRNVHRSIKYINPHYGL